MKKVIKRLEDQRGSALLLTLGILSLVLIMAMSFAFSARTTRQVAKINADLVKARLLAESGLERVLAAMSYNYDGDIYPSEQDAAPSWPFQDASGTGFSQKYLASAGSDYQIKRFLSTDPPTSTETALPIVNILTSPTAIGFQRVDVDPGTAETIGRIAFLVLEEANKLDLNQMLTLRNYNTTYTVNLPFIPNKTTNGNPFNDGMLASLSDNYNSTASDFLYDITNGMATVDETNTVRLGLNMQEIQIDNSYRTKLPDGFPGFAGTKAPWFSYRHLWNVMWEPNVLPITDARRYTFFSGEDIEAYWHQDSEDAAAGTGERQRFDITGTEWGGWEHAGTLAGAQRLVTELGGSTVRSAFSDPTPVPDYAQASGDPATVGFGIPHLAGLGALREQVAANMIDFCDLDNLATYYPSTYGLDSTSSPEYFGNEAVAYFNEVVVKVVAYKTLLDPSDPDYLTHSNYSLEVNLYPELLNIFPANVPVGRIQVRLYGVAQISIAGGAYTDLSSFDSATPLNFMWPLSGTNTPPGFYTPASGTVQLDPPRKVPDSSSVAYRFQVSRVVMISDSGTDGELYDTGFYDTNTATVDIAASIFAEATGYPVCVSWEVGDPRNNQWAASWTVRLCAPGEDESFTTPPACPTLGAVNQHFITESSVAISPDVEAYASMDFLSADTTFSTAFIPDRPFRSLWELGAIHRGEAFRTLDIAGVDAAIVDQVKIGPLKRTRGKFNINSRNDAALAKLFQNIDMARHYEDVEKDEQTAAGAILVSPSLSSTPSLSRANIASELVAEAVAAASPVVLNDRQREALIGRTANLLTTRVDKYSVLVVGQALKDLSGAGITAANWDDVKKTVINPTEYGGGYYSILGTQRILAHIVRDAWRNEYKVVQMQLLED